MQTKILKEGPVLISSLLAHKHLRGYTGFPSQYDCRSQHCFPSSFGQQILKLKAQVNLTEALLNERKLFPRTNQSIYFSD